MSVRLVTNWALRAESHAVKALSRHLQCRSLSTQVVPPKKVAFAFDIDGVLKAGQSLLPGALRTLDILDGQNPLQRKVPYIFITNGGGLPEAVRAEHLSQHFNRKISVDQIVQSHTVFQSLSERFRSSNILAVGGPDSESYSVRDTMEAYGFDYVFRPKDILLWNSSVWPFLPRRKSPAKGEQLIQADFSRINFEAVLVFHDSRDWGCDIQLICDVLRSPTGIIGHVGNDTHPQPFLAFSHGDLQWGTDFPTPRFGQGAFQHAVKAVYEATSGRKLEAVTFGKPERLTYAYAETLIKERASDIYGEASDLDVWMIGDNPASDIAGANAFGWNSALLSTGVYRGKTHGSPAFQPTLFADNVEQAICRILSEQWRISL